MPGRREGSEGEPRLPVQKGGQVLRQYDRWLYWVHILVLPLRGVDKLLHLFLPQFLYLQNENSNYLFPEVVVRIK